jgi:hypothetical protein
VTDGDTRARMARIAIALLADLMVPIVVAALVTLVVLFSGVVSQFAYVDF